MDSPISIRDRARDYWEIDGIPSAAYGMIWLVIVLAIMVPIASVGALTRIHSELLKGVTQLLFVSWPLLILLLLVWLSLNLQDLIEKVKLHTTYPRTGYVAPPSYWTSNPAARFPRWARILKFGLRFLWLCFFVILLTAKDPEAWIFLALGLSSGSIESIQDHFEGKPLAKLPISMLSGIAFWIGIYIVLTHPWNTGIRIAVIAVAIAGLSITLVNSRFSRHIVIPVLFLAGSLALIFSNHNASGAVLLLLAPGLTLLIDGLLTFALYIRSNPLRSA